LSANNLYIKVISCPSKQTNEINPDDPAFYGSWKIYAQTDSAQPPVVDSAFYYNVEIHAEFTGGNQFWKRYVEKNIEYPSNEIMGNVVLQILVSKEGTFDSIEIVSDSPELHKESNQTRQKANLGTGRSKWQEGQFLDNGYGNSIVLDSINYFKIKIGVPIGVCAYKSSISSFVRPMQPFVQSFQR
jgi:hypothetical protein